MSDVEYRAEQIAVVAREMARLDLVNVVRCRDCKHMHTVRSWLGMDVDECWLHADPETGALGKNRTEPNGFCAWAERAGNFTTCKCGEDIEISGRESVTCPSCGRVITE